MPGKLAVVSKTNRALDHSKKMRAICANCLRSGLRPSVVIKIRNLRLWKGLALRMARARNGNGMSVMACAPMTVRTATKTLDG
jgi:hypothetical protein